MSIGKMDSFLFVSDYEEEWQMDRDLNTNRCWTQRVLSVDTIVEPLNEFYGSTKIWGRFP